MTSSVNNSNHLPVQPGPNRFPFRPQTPLGVWALVAAALAIASWFLLPLITITYRDVYPITDTWVMPAILTLLTDTAAVLNIWAVWRKRERSIPNLLALGLMVPAALFVTFMVVGEGLAGV